MAIVGSLHEQHRELRRLADGIAALCHAESLARNGMAARLRLSAFVRKVRVHLALEERFVCERLLRHSDRAIVALVTQHQNDMRSLQRRVTEYASRWSSELDIQKSPPQFIEETMSLLEMTTKRFELEDSDLYPVVEQIMTPSGTWPLDLMASRRVRNAG